MTNHHLRVRIKLYGGNCRGTTSKYALITDALPQGGVFWGTVTDAFSQEGTSKLPPEDDQDVNMSGFN